MAEENKIMTQNLLKKLALLKIDVKKFHCYNRDRKNNGIKIGFRRETIMGFFFKNKKKNKEEETVTPVVETTPEVPAKEGMILVREGIKLGLPTVSMEEAIVAAGELLRDLGYVDDDYIPAMIRRNEEASVYMGLGLAIPHGTEDAKRDVKRSGIIVMQYPDGVEFNGGTAQLVIGIAGVGDEHLEILGQITEAVTEEEILEELKKTTDVDYILNTFTN